jgi:uncharacterized protein
MIHKRWRWLPIGLGWTALGLGLIGLFLPLVPTVPFVLLAAFFFSKGSGRLHRRLREHPRFGHFVRDWEAEHVIPPLGKWVTTLLVAPLIGYAFLFPGIPLPASLAVVAAVVAILGFVWTRPSRRSNKPG